MLAEIIGFILGSKLYDKLKEKDKEKEAFMEDESKEPMDVQYMCKTYGRDRDLILKAFKLFKKYGKI